MLQGDPMANYQQDPKSHKDIKPPSDNYPDVKQNLVIGRSAASSSYEAICGAVGFGPWEFSFGLRIQN